MFNNILEKKEDKEFIKIIKNLDGKICLYNKGDIIKFEKNIGIILDGIISIEKYDYNGNKTVLERLENNFIFGEKFLYLKNDISITAIKNCKIFWFEYDNVIKNIKNNTIINNIFDMVINKVIELNTRLEILSKRSIKDKLLTYFLILSKKKHSKNFTLPFTYTELADYLSIDRSAMMREIKKLKENGFIKTNNKNIKLIKI